MRRFPYSLNGVWRECLRMLRDIRDPDGPYFRMSIWRAKSQWLKDNGYRCAILDDCFFCEYAIRIFRKKPRQQEPCRFCPAAKIDPNFDCCSVEYHYVFKSDAFLAKLEELNTKRLHK